MEPAVSDADFTVETTGEIVAEESPSTDSAPPVAAPETPATPPQETPEDTDAEPPAAAAAPAKAAPSAERNPDGTFKKAAKKNPQERIDHVTWEREEARREAARERERAERLERELQALRAPRRDEPAPVTPTDWQRYRALADAPKSADFTDYEDYQAALALFIADKRIEEREQRWQAQASATQRQQAATERFEAFNKRMSSVLERDPEFLSRISPELLSIKPLSALQPGERGGPLNVLAEEIIMSSVPEQFFEHFTAHPDDIRRLVALLPREFLREFARLEARFGPATPGAGPQPPAISQAKPPITPVGSAPPAVEDEGSDDEPVERFIERENARIRKARRQ